MSAESLDAYLATWHEQDLEDLTTFRIDSPLATVVPPLPDTDMPVRGHPSSNNQQPSSKTPAAAAMTDLMFVNIQHPKQLKDRNVLQRNRKHVMKTYLERAALDPDNRDIRAQGVANKQSRPRKPPKAAVETSASRKKDALCGSASLTSDHQLKRRPSVEDLSLEFDEDAKARTRLRIPANIARGRKANEKESPLLQEMRSIFGNAGYITTNLKDIPGPSCDPAFEDGDEKDESFVEDVRPTPGPTAGSSLGAPLQPFNAWPKLANPKLDINKLKWSCGSQFASVGLVTHWLPALLQARPAFLSTICISASHDDIMSRGLMPVEERSNHESAERMLVRIEVINMVNAAVKDPQQQTTDATIIAVLHLLNSEIMGCDGSAMKRHQTGLHAMIGQRGGLARLGVNGQLANALTITMYLISALRETEPQPEYSHYATQKRVEPPDFADKYPVSPVYCPRSGFSTLKRSLRHPPLTYNLLEDLRLITSAFVHRSTQPQTNLHGSPGHAACDEVWDLCVRIFNRPSALSSLEDFEGMNERYTYEALRLTARVYATALTHEVPFSQAAVIVGAHNKASSHAANTPQEASSPPQWLPGAVELDDDCTPMHILIMQALMKTDLSKTWGNLAGTLFWIALIGGACGNPDFSPAWSGQRAAATADMLNFNNNSVDSATFSTPAVSATPPPRTLTPAEQEYEDARKVLSAIAVRCSILMSFEYGNAILETLRRVVGIEQALARADAESQARTAAAQTAYSANIRARMSTSHTPSVSEQNYNHFTTVDDRFTDPASVSAATTPPMHTAAGASRAGSVAMPSMYGPQLSREYQLGFNDFARDFQF